ncbi:zinc finger NFX1-type containing 1 [Phyllostomus discolor]|uniref:Zinc finger NFX1-type containing 1 n=1 Tax=Phyllostomus discolor TaxID=89673 RepID=A0A834DRW1_9CHIR|nr:zinc finger NFX1-type containing 1 [Phyllostomus discolor]
MEDRRPCPDARPRNPHNNHRGPIDGELPRARNQANNPPANVLRGGANLLGRHPRADNHPVPYWQREERFAAMGRNPHPERRNRGGHANDEPRGQRQGQENDTRQRNGNQEGRNRRPPWPDENFQQRRPPYQKPAGQPQQVKKLGYKFLESLLQKDPSEVVITLASSLGLKELLSHSFMKPNLLELICQVLRKACSSKMDRQSILHVLGILKNSKFLKVCLPNYVVGMITEPSADTRNRYPEHISNIICLLQELVSVFPASSMQETSMLISLLPHSLNALRASGVDIEEETEKNLEKVQTIIEHLQEKRREGTLREDTYTLVQTKAEDHVESYRTMPIYPTYNEVHLDEKPFLRPNIIAEKYESTAVYLDTHFRLLREDFVRPLREGILELLQSFEDQGLRKRKFDDIRIYFDTRIITPVCSSSGIVYKVRFDTKPLKNVRWQNSKRLLYGSLVCMSKDNFETFLFATVSNREQEDLRQGFVQLCFNEQSQELLAEVHPSDSFLMVETTAYFEAYRHVLEGLQEIQDLENHPSVLKYEKIKGVSSNLYFIEHNFPEQEIQEGKSHQNQHEAHFVVELCKYFLCQEYLPSQITILTTYTGQLFCLRKLMPAETFAHVKVHVVDKYQGEENDIILLSLVRSNQEGKVGFLQISNRICVALSRAKKGMYCIGNMQMLAKVPLWSKIIHTLRENNQIGQTLRLCCQNHPNTYTVVSKASDFQRVPEGGCNLPCEFRLDCGHVCTRACHPYDPLHKKFQCMKPCQKVICKDRHRCPLVCFQECQPCQVKVPKVILRCGHEQMVPCSLPESDFCCQEPCSKVLKCGHRCSHPCGESCVRLCSEMVTVKLKCGHSQQVKCGNVEDLKYDLPVKCTTKCGAILDCGHRCPGSCHSCFEGRFHERCQQPCKRLLICSHKCQEPCIGECPPCQRTCQNRCVHSQCKKKCGELCSPCVEPCVWRCQHYQCTKLCSEPCNRPPCYVPCTKLLACGHPCIGLCGEPCPTKCRVCHQEEVTQIFFGFEDEPDARFVQLEDCSHIFEVQALDQYMNEQKDDEVAIRLKVCPMCQVPIRKNLRYGTSIKQRLEEIEMVKEKIQGSAGEIATSQEKLKVLLEGKSLLHQMLPGDVLMLTEKLAQKNLSVKDLGLVENYINFYDYLARLWDSLKKVHFSEQSKVRTRLNQVHEWLAKKRLSFTSQELDDLQSEIQRLTYLVDLLTRCKMAEGKVSGTVAEEVCIVRRILEGTCKFTQKDEQLVQKKMEALKASLPCSGLGISERERVQIVKAIGLPLGHWFKCPNGHIYVIGDCGGAMQRSTCPECKEVIGGVNHTLERSNELASEMDGAQHAAWSDTANNLMNFEEIHRLM